MKTELEKQQAGIFYNPSDEEIKTLQRKSRDFMREYNSEANTDQYGIIMKKWFKKVGNDCYIEPPFYCDFGCNLELGNNVYINTNCVILDSTIVSIDNNTMLGPNVQIITPFHSVNPDERKLPENECAKPVVIGKDCWIGAGVIILPGVKIGDGSTIGAGSVVTKDIPPRTVALGTPCKVIKTV